MSSLFSCDIPLNQKNVQEESKLRSTMVFKVKCFTKGNGLNARGYHNLDAMFKLLKK